MFVEEIKTTRKGKIYRSVLIRETFRSNGKVMHRTLANISNLPKAHIDSIKRSLSRSSGKTSAKIVLEDNTPKILETQEYGASYAILSIIQKLELDKIIYSKKTAWRENVLAMICGRIMFQGSKLSLVNKYRDTKLWELCGHVADHRPDVDRDCYAALDHLLSYQKRIQNKIARKHLSDGCLVLYDLSSSYLTGEYEESDLVEFGYSRDRKRGLRQINFGLLTNEDGCPISIEVFPGNTCDQATVTKQTQCIIEEFGVKRVVFVGDRGMLTPKRIKEVNDQGFRTITALTHAQMSDLLAREIIIRNQFQERFVTSVADPTDSSIRYILCFNPHRQSNDNTTRKSLIEKTETALKEICNRKRKKDAKSVGASVGKIWKSYKTEKYFNWDITEEGNMEYSLKEDVIAAEENLDGCYVIRTDVPESELSAEKVLLSYRKLSQVEQAFRCIKTTSLNLRPIHHHIDDRIRAHVFLCMLSYYVEWHMLKMLQPIFSQTKKGKDRRWSFEQVIERLKSIRNHTCIIGGITVRDLKSSPDEEQQLLLECLGVQL